MTRKLLEDQTKTTCFIQTKTYLSHNFILIEEFSWTDPKEPKSTFNFTRKIFQQVK